MWSRNAVRNVEEEERRSPPPPRVAAQDRNDLPDDDLTVALIAPDLAAEQPAKGVRADATKAPAAELPGERRRGLRSLAVNTLALLGIVLLLSVGYLVAETAGWLPSFSTERLATAASEPQAPAPPQQQQPVAAAQPQAQPSPMPQEQVQTPDAPTMDVASLVMLIRSTILALDQANRTGDYSVLLAMGAPGLRQGVTPEDFARAFTNLRDRAVNLSTVAVANPTLDGEPMLGVEGGQPMMRLTGTFPGVAELIAFDMIFEQRDGRWLLFGLGVSPTGKPSPLPPSGPAVVDGKPALPPPYMMMAMARDAVIALNQANLTGNYDVVAKLSAPGFREANPPTRLAELFAALRQRNIDLSPVTVIDPGLYAAPALMDNGMLRLTGFFPSEPERVNFDLAFEYVEGAWKLFGLGVNTSREVAANDAAAPGPANVQDPDGTDQADLIASNPGVEPVAADTAAMMSTLGAAPPTPRPRPTIVGTPPQE